jgi:hypothetical protein
MTEGVQLSLTDNKIIDGAEARAILADAAAGHRNATPLVTDGSTEAHEQAATLIEAILAGYGQFWGMRSGSGLVLGSGYRLAVAEADALDDFREALGAVQPTPLAFGRPCELEDHGERGRTG